MLLFKGIKFKKLLNPLLKKVDGKFKKRIKLLTLKKKQWLFRYNPENMNLCFKINDFQK